MFNFMKKTAEKDDKEKRKREKKERKDVKKRDRSSMSAEELLRLDEVNVLIKKQIWLQYCPFSIVRVTNKTVWPNNGTFRGITVIFSYWTCDVYSFGYRILQ